MIIGHLGVVLDGERHVLEAGEQLLIPPGTSHTFWNAGQGELRFITDVRPPGELQTYWGLMLVWKSQRLDLQEIGLSQ